MTIQEKQSAVNRGISELGLEERGVFCSYEEAHPAHDIKAGFWVGTEETDDGQKFPPDAGVDEMIAFAKSAYIEYQ